MTDQTHKHMQAEDKHRFGNKSTSQTEKEGTSTTLHPHPWQVLAAHASTSPLAGLLSSAEGQVPGVPAVVCLSGYPSTLDSHRQL